MIRFLRRKILKKLFQKAQHHVLSCKQSLMRYAIYFFKMLYYLGTKISPMNRRHSLKRSSKSLLVQCNLKQYEFFLREEIHQIVANVKKRCASADWVSILSNHLVVQFTQHYRQARQSTFVSLFFSLSLVIEFLSSIVFVPKQIHFIYRLI